MGRFQFFAFVLFSNYCTMHRLDVFRQRRVDIIIASEKKAKFFSCRPKVDLLLRRDPVPQSFVPMICRKKQEKTMGKIISFFKRIKLSFDSYQQAHSNEQKYDTLISQIRRFCRNFGFTNSLVLQKLSFL